MLRDVSAPYPNVIVETFTGLLVEFAQKKQADALVRGLRAVSDFENEFQMALTNRKLAPDLETVFLMTSAENMFVSSSIVKEVAALGGDVRGLVPAQVELELRKAFKR
jgi:pantetheine-phosphate adenylyltransferase